MLRQACSLISTGDSGFCIGVTYTLDATTGLPVSQQATFVNSNAATTLPGGPGTVTLQPIANIKFSDPNFVITLAAE